MIGGLLERLLALGCVRRVVVVDDASPDGTGNIVERLAQDSPVLHLIRRPERSGVGGAMLDGIRFALEDHADIVVLMDADGSYRPDDLWALVDAVRSTDAGRPGVALGSRWTVGAHREHWDPLPSVANWALNVSLRRRHGLRARDCSSGFRALNRQAATTIAAGDEWPPGFAFSVATLHELERRGAEVVEVPVRFRGRHTGATKRTLLDAVGAFQRLSTQRTRTRGDVESVRR